MATQKTATAKANGPEAAIRAAGGVWNDWMQQTLAISQEVSSFVMARASEDLGALTQLAGCKDPVQFFTCQQQHAQKAAEDYIAEGQKLGRMIVAAQTRWVNPDEAD